MCTDDPIADREGAPAESKPPPAVALHYLLQFFVYDHLKSREMRQTSARFSALADFLVETLPDNPERTTALRKLLEAKDCAVRALLFK